MATEAQKRARNKWNEAHKKLSYYYNSKSRAKSFILKQATLDDLQVIEEYIKQRRQVLQEKEKCK